MKKLTVPLLITFFLVSISFINADVWKIKSEESQISFSARSAFTRVHGTIPGIKGDIKFNENDLRNSSFEVSIDAKGINTGNNKRDKHLRSADFLDVEKYPSIKFKSKRINKAETGFAVTGDLTIKDVTKEITFPFTFENQNTRGIFKGSFAINRREYNVGGKTRLAGDNIDIEVVTVVENAASAKK